MKQLIDQDSKRFRNALSPILKRLIDLTKDLGQEEMQETATQLLDAVYDPFMFVIVGEVKAGKSSFINALLNTGEEICKVAPAPMTDKIQQIVFGEEDSETQVSPYIRRITKNEPILRNIAIVDTPGTNTIIAHHQELTESFIPSSDLIVFVFEAKNPYRQSAWEFFEFINTEWRKKIIFVLQQKDLLPEGDLKINIEGVRNHAMQKGITEARVFDVSALDELEGRHKKSGFEPLREYIRSNITGKNAVIQKLDNLSHTATTITERISDGIATRKKQLEYDISFRTEIKKGLNHQEEKSNRYIQLLSENIVGSYIDVMLEKKKELKANIGFVPLIRRSVNAIFNNEHSLRNWLESFSKSTEEKLNKAFSKRLDEGVTDISESIQEMAKLVDNRIRNSKTILKDNHELFADIAEKRAQVLQDLNQTFKSFMENSESFYPESVGSRAKALVPDMAKGSGLAVVGIILTAITNAAAFDITGGILTALGLSFAGITLGFNKSSILKSYDDAMQSGKQKIKTELAGRLEQYTHKIKLKIEDNFREFDNHITDERTAVDKLEQDMNVLNKDLLSFRSMLG